MLLAGKRGFATAANPIVGGRRYQAACAASPTLSDTSTYILGSISTPYYSIHFTMLKNACQNIEKKRRQRLVALFLHFSGCLSAADTTRLKLDTSRLKLNMNRGKISAGASWCPCCIFTLLLLLQETSRPTPANSSHLLQKS